MHTLATTVPEANPIRGLYLTSLAPPVVDRLVSATEAKECALRLASAAVANGPRPVVSRPAAPTDDDVTVLAFIEQHRDPVVEERARTVHLEAKVFSVQVPKKLVAGSPIEELALLVASQFGQFPDAKKGSFAYYALTLLNPSAKPKAKIQDAPQPPADERDRLLLAASMILNEVQLIDIERSMATPPLIAPA